MRFTGDSVTEISLFSGGTFALSIFFKLLYFFYFLKQYINIWNITKATFGRSWKTIHEEDAGFKWRHILDYSPQTRPYRTVLWKWAEYRLGRLPFLLTQKIINNAIYNWTPRHLSIWCLFLLTSFEKSMMHSALCTNHVRWQNTENILIP